MEVQILDSTVNKQENWKDNNRCLKCKKRSRNIFIGKSGTLKKGETVTILQTSNGWHKIELSSGKTGWVSADYIKITTSSNSGSTSGGDSSMDQHQQ